MTAIATQTNDCCETKAGLIPLDKAVALALAKVSPIAQTEQVDLAKAVGRIVAEDMFAPEAMPFFDNSAMDGFALALPDLGDGNSLPLAGTVAAGSAPRDLPKGAALEIFTGAPLPFGADTIVMFEDTTVVGDRVFFQNPPKPGGNIRRQGSDQPLGACLVKRGQRLAPRHVGLLAANGFSEVLVTRQPRVAVFSTGDELAGGGKMAGQIHDANRPMLLALAREAGADATDLGILPDDLDVITQAFADLHGRFDLVLTSGAVSTGGRDHVRDALVAAGGTLDGWRVALKPGKPVAFGHLGSTVVTGLPGNPFSAYTGFHLFAEPQIARLAGDTPSSFATVPARAGFRWKRKSGRAEVFPARIVDHDAAGMPVLERLGSGVSATLFPLAEADGLGIVAAETERVESGDVLSWQPFCKGGAK
jgi:molybdopterin molybdotransferase